MAQAVLSKRGEEERHAPDSETPPQPTPEISKTLSEEQFLARISEERAKRATAERVLQENLKEQERFRGLLGGLRSTFFDADGSARTRLEQEYEQLKAQYDRTDETYLRAVGEYMESTVQSEVDARSKLYEAEVEALSDQNKSEGGQELNPVYRAWKALDKINSEWSAQKILGEKLKLSLPENTDPRLASVLRFAGKVVTPRTAIALGLVGVGFGVYGIAAKGIEAGLGAVAGLATMRGIGVSVLSRDVMKWAREELPLVKLQPKYDKEKPWYQRIQLFEKLTPESIAALSPEEIQQRLVDASSAITLYGNKELLRDPRYQELLKAYSAQTIEGQRQFEEAGGEQTETPEATEKRADQYLKYLDGDIKELGSKIQKAQKEKKIKGVTTIALLTAAAVVLPGIAHLRRLEEIHPGEMMKLIKEAGKTVQEAFGSLVKFLDFCPPSWADTGETPAAPAAQGDAAQTAAAEAGGGGGEAAPQLSDAEAWGKNLGKEFSVSGAEDKFLVTAKIGSEGLLENTTHQDQVVRVFLSRYYGGWLAGKYGGTIPKHALDAIENVIQNLKDPAIVEKIVGEKVNIVSHDPADSSGRTLQIAFMGKNGEPLDKLMEHALKVATPNAGGTYTAHDLWETRLGHPVEDFKTGKPPVAAPSGAGEPKTGAHPEAKPAVKTAVDARAPVGAAEQSRAGAGELKEGSKAVPNAQKGLTTDETIDEDDRRLLSGLKGPLTPAEADRIGNELQKKYGSPFVQPSGASLELAPSEAMDTSAPRLADQAIALLHEQGKPFVELGANRPFFDKLATQGVIIDQTGKAITLSRAISEGVTDNNAMIGLLNKLLIGDIEALKVREGIGELRSSDKGSIYQVFKDLAKEGALRVEGGRVLLSYDPAHIDELFDKALHAKHVSVDRVAGKISPDEWKRMLSWEERKVSGSGAVPPLEAASGSSTVTPPGSGSVAPVIEAVPGSAVASPAVPAAAPTEAPASVPVTEATPRPAPSSSPDTSSGVKGAQQAESSVAQKADLASMTLDQKHTALEEIAKTLGKEGTINPDLLSLALFREGGMTVGDLAQTVENHLKSVPTPNLSKLLQLDNKFSHGDLMGLHDYLLGFKPSSAEHDMRVMDYILKKNLK